MLESKRQADERRNELVQRLKIANATSLPSPWTANPLPIEEAYSAVIPSIEHDPDLDTLRGMPRFKEILARLPP